MSEHGTHSKYVMGCRCADCTRATRDWKREYRTLPWSEKPGLKVVHGTPNLYINHGCRCEECTRAQAEHQIAYYHRTKKWYDNKKKSEL